MIYLQLVWEFLKTGLFAIGGGYATLPFLANISETYGWFTKEELVNFIAISEVTPGPIGINAATFAGFYSGGVPGGILASVALALPAFLIILTLLRISPNFHEKPLAQKIFYGMIPVAIALIAATGLELFDIALLSFPSVGKMVGGWILFILLLLLYLPKYPIKISPFFILFLGGLWGFIFL